MQQRPASDIDDIVIDDEFKYLLPSLDPESFVTLEADILEHGLRDALWQTHGLWEAIKTCSKTRVGSLSTWVGRLRLA